MNSILWESGSDIVTTSTGATGECGVVETSVTASEVIQKFEKVSKTSMSSSMTSYNLFQDTVSSRLKKISAEEFIANERKTSSSTGEFPWTLSYSTWARVYKKNWVLHFYKTIFAIRFHLVKGKLFIRSGRNYFSINW